MIGLGKGDKGVAILPETGLPPPHLFPASKNMYCGEKKHRNIATNPLLGLQMQRAYPQVCRAFVKRDSFSQAKRLGWGGGT